VTAGTQAGTAPGFALRTPPSLTAAALPGYAAAYGRSVLELDLALAAAPAPDGLIDLTHGDTRAFVPPASAHRIPLQQDAAGRLSFAPGALAAAARAGARLLVLSHPNNPTGGVYTAAAAAALADLVTSTDMLAVVDQLYCRLVFAGTGYVHLGALPGWRSGR
jgi:aspartate/methionine/tyrosine aminotransferase